MNQKTKNILSTLFRIGLSCFLLYYLYTKIDVEKTVTVLKAADLGYILYAGIVFLIINAVLFLRWVIYIKAFELTVSIKTVARYFFIGLFGNLFLPSAIGGDFIKTIGLCLYSPHKAKVVASVLLDRLSGFAGMVVVAIVSFSFGFHLINDWTLFFAIVGMTVVSSAIVFILFNEKAYSFCCQIFSRLPKVKNALMSLHYDIALLKDRRIALYQSVGLSCLVQMLSAVLYLLIGKALQQDIGIIYLFIFIPLICVAASMPSIGGLGVREAGAAYLLAKIGIESGISVSISLVSFLFMVAMGLVGGMIYVATKSPVIDKPASK
ncbi:MAG: YbhN family protein, partial [Candidatus Paceibacterales bacterium]